MQRPLTTKLASRGIDIQNFSKKSGSRLNSIFNARYVPEANIAAKTMIRPWISDLDCPVIPYFQAITMIGINTVGATQTIATAAETTGEPS